jgi:hypothetical protein
MSPDSANALLGPAVTVLGIVEEIASEQRQIRVSRSWHPIRELHSEARGPSCVDDRRIVVNE